MVFVISCPMGTTTGYHTVATAVSCTWITTWANLSYVWGFPLMLVWSLFADLATAFAVALRTSHVERTPYAVPHVPARRPRGARDGHWVH